MPDRDRRVHRLTWANSFLQTEGNVHGNIEIDKGDLLFIDRTDGLRIRGASTADYYVYPFSKCSGSTNTLDSNRTLAVDNFVGIAATHSESGVTESIGIHYTGLFQYPLRNARKTKVGYRIIPTGSGVTLYSQKVAISSDSTEFIGLATDSGNFRSTVDMVIFTLFNPIDKDSF